MNIFIDPGSAVKSFVGKYPWLLPFLLVCIVSVVLGWMMGPVMIRVFQANPPENVKAEQMEQAMTVMGIMTKVGVLSVPLIHAVKLLLVGALIAALSTMMSVKTDWKQQFTLLAYASMVQLLQGIAAFVVVMAKGSDIQSMQELNPPFGLNIFLTELPKAVDGLLGYFSIFTIWYLVVLLVGYSKMTGASKGQAMIALIPAWALGALMAMVSSLFQQ